MRKIFSSIMLITVISLFIGSCTVEKRLYNKGFYVQWNHSYKGGEEVSADVAEGNSDVLLNEIAPINSVIIEETVASNDETYNEVINEVVVPSIENNTAVVENETETKLEKNNSVKTNFVNTLNPLKVKSKGDKFTKPVIRKILKSDSNSAGGPPKGLLMLLCFFIPWLAVGLATDWDLMPLIFNLLWSLTCIGGIIHALVVVSREA